MIKSVSKFGTRARVKHKNRLKSIRIDDVSNMLVTRNLVTRCQACTAEWQAADNGTGTRRI